MKVFKYRLGIDNTLSPGRFKPGNIKIPDSTFRLVKRLDNIFRNVSNEPNKKLWKELPNRFESQSAGIQQKLDPYIYPIKSECISTGITHHELPNISDGFSMNIIRVKDGFVIIRRNKNQQIAFYLTKRKDKLFRIAHIFKFYSNRDPRFWYDVEVKKNKKGKKKITLIGYSASRDLLVKRNPKNKKETKNKKFTVTPEIENQKNKYDLERRYNRVSESRSSKFIGKSNPISVFYDYDKNSLAVIDLANSNKLWYIKDEENIYENTVVYREMVVTCGWDKIIGRELLTGDLIFHKDWDNGKIYGPPFVLEGGLFICTLDGYLWEVTVKSNKSTRISRKWNPEQRLSGDSAESSITMRNWLNDQSQMNKDAGIYFEKVYQFSMYPSYNKCCIPIIRNNECFLYGHSPIPGGDFELLISNIHQNFKGHPIKWIFERLNKETTKKMLKILPLSTGDLSDVHIEHYFKEALSTSLFRSKEYYESNKHKSFIDSYEFESHYNNNSLPSKRTELKYYLDEIRYISSEDSFNLIFECVSRSFKYLSFPDFNTLFFSDRKKVIKRLLIDFDNFTPLIQESQVGKRALYILDDINQSKYIKGINDKDNDELTKRIQNLDEYDKIFIYEKMFLSARKINVNLARALKHCTRTAGLPTRSIAYAFLEGLISKTEYYQTDVYAIFRAISQIKWFAIKTGEPKLNITRPNSMLYEYKDPNQSDLFGEMFGSNFSMSVYIKREIQFIYYSINNNKESDSINGFKRLKDNLDYYLLDIENEKLQFDFLNSIHPVFPMLINYLLDKDLISDAFDIYESMKSMIFRLYLSDENKKVLLDRISNERMYKQLRNAKKELSIKSNNTRGSSIKLLSTNNPNKFDKNIQSQLINNGVQFYGWDDLSKTIDENSILVEYYISEDKTGVFLGLKDKNISYYELADVDKAERIQSKLRGHIGKDIPVKLINKYLSELYEILIAPIWEHLIGYDTIIVVPSSFLYNIPFTGLFDGDKYLIQKKNVVIEPSSQIFIYGLIHNGEISCESVDAFFSPKEILPGAESEKRIISELFQSKLTTSSNFNKIKQNIRGDILHISTHGNFNSDEPLLSTISINKNESISVIDIYTYNLSSVKLALVNTCVSGVVDITANDELIGLVRGLITAGCSSVINTLWKLNDKVAPVFSESFYKSLKTSKDPVKAFSTSINKIITSPEFSHPYYWACYQFYG